jgi:DNA adenine methylase
MTEKIPIITNNVSPLRYPGGKTRACKTIDTIMQQSFDLSKFDTLVSPFFGGGSFEFYFQNKYHYSLCVNDKFTPLYHFWKEVKENKQELCEELRKRPFITKEDFLHYRKNIKQGNENRLQEAIQYFIINRCSFSGSTLSGGFSEESSKKRYTPSSIDRMEALDFRAIELHNVDFEEFIEKHHSDTSLLFLDPPYYL